MKGCRLHGDATLLDLTPALVVDTSAIVAMAFGEPERDAFAQAIQQADKALISTVSALEARMVVHGRRGQRAVVLVDDLMRLPVFEIVAPGVAEMDAAALQDVTPCPCVPLLRGGDGNCENTHQAFIRGRRIQSHCRSGVN